MKKGTLSEQRQYTLLRTEGKGEKKNFKKNKKEREEELLVVQEKILGKCTILVKKQE